MVEKTIDLRGLCQLVVLIRPSRASRQPMTAMLPHTGPTSTRKRLYSFVIAVPIATTDRFLDRTNIWIIYVDDLDVAATFDLI